MFDAASFLNATIDQVNATEIKPAPEGEYVGQIQPVTSESFKSGTTKDGNAWARIDLQVVVENNPTIKAATGLDKKTIRAGVMLDLTPSGGLDFSDGRNITLGRLRKAVGLNNPGQPFSFQQLGGRMVKINVKHRIDKDDPSKVYEDVKGFLPV